MSALGKHFREQGKRRPLLASEKGSMVWYLIAAVGGIAVFYVVFFVFWAEIRSWFIVGH